ncbi:hypothetical protein F8154_05530 [Alkaliphilus pronyensis]|uniref:Tocopherol cyclase n=1 Tax=Alkaliphilus pronyensis TaxID=1482732 RepID=A0A6I0FDB5_9FIRM|nr:tocopherol cyclase family protein [Alkaliphilus pronyensis]KAB3535760.1 hypothetical protein F8154_05530 [Alkaliphilus pronyensis]
MYLLKKLFNPEIFQGGFKKKNYFEGWYFKLIDENTNNILAIIPGISYESKNEKSHGFIQVFLGKENKTYYISFPTDNFSYSKDTFEISINKNYFSNNKIVLSLKSSDCAIEGELSFTNIVPFPKSFLNPGIMGPFSFIPFMECYHGIVNIHHNIKGALLINGINTSFDNGYGYIEKDWGTSFPEAYIWLQSNHFAEKDVSVMFSIAKIPWLKRHFIGHISFLRIGDSFYRFATYTGAIVKSINISNNMLEATIKDGKGCLQITAYFSNSSILLAPQNGVMKRDILESITAKVYVKLSDNKGNIIFEGEGANTGLEMVGDLSLLAT